MKIYQETYDNFCRDFCEEVNTHRDSDSKHIGAISKQIQETEGKGTKAQWILIQPTRWWIRISKTPQGRWIDPDLLNLNLTAMDEGKWVGFEPTRFICYIKGKRPGFTHSFNPFLFLLLPHALLSSTADKP